MKFSENFGGSIFTGQMDGWEWSFRDTNYSCLNGLSNNSRQNMLKSNLRIERPTNEGTSFYRAIPIEPDDLHGGFGKPGRWRLNYDHPIGDDSIKMVPIRIRDYLAP